MSSRRAPKVGLRCVVSAGAGFVFDPEVGHEGEATDFAAEPAQPPGRGMVGVVEEVVAGRVPADRNTINLADSHVALIASPALVEFAPEGPRVQATCAGVP